MKFPENMSSFLWVCTAIGGLISIFYFACGSSSPYSLSFIFPSIRIEKPHQALNKRDRQLCTFSLLREYMKTYGYFPGDGKWLVNHKTPYFQPDFCKFHSIELPAGFLSKCLLQGNISSIVTIGDSTASRSSQALSRFTTKCIPLKHEEIRGRGFLPDKLFFKAKEGTDNTWEKFVYVHSRYCSGCISGTQNCSVGTAPEVMKSINITHVAMTMTLDDSVQLHAPIYHEAGPSLDTAWALTTQELIFRYYLKGRYPDVLIIFPPFNHDKHRQSSWLKAELAYFKSLIDLHIPRTTKIVFIPTSSEFEKKRKNKFWVNRTFENMLATEKIDKLNHILYETLEKDLLDPDGRMYGFLDMVKVSNPKEEWCLEGVHMAPVWYHSQMSMFWQLYCNSVLNDAF